MMRLRRKKITELVPWSANGKGDRRELLASRDGVATDGDNRKFVWFGHRTCEWIWALSLATNIRPHADWLSPKDEPN